MLSMGGADTNGGGWAVCAKAVPARAKLNIRAILPGMIGIDIDILSSRSQLTLNTRRISSSRRTAWRRVSRRSVATPASISCITDISTINSYQTNSTPPPGEMSRQNAIQFDNDLYGDAGCAAPLW